MKIKTHKRKHAYNFLAIFKLVYFCLFFKEKKNVKAHVQHHK